MNDSIIKTISLEKIFLSCLKEESSLKFGTEKRLDYFLTQVVLSLWIGPDFIKEDNLRVVRQLAREANLGNHNDK